MPSLHTLKTYLTDGYYHIYNRGVEKRLIFQDEHDYATFLFYLKLYLSPPELVEPALISQDSPRYIKKIKLNLKQVSLFGKVELIAYCLMPNHFHLLVHQKPEHGICELMRKLGTAYTMVFNRRYQRIGPLFQSRYKAVLVETDNQLLYLTKYIHRNPLKILKNGSLETYPFSSLPQYLNLQKTAWLKPEIVLGFFAKQNQAKGYGQFVFEAETAEAQATISSLLLED